MLQSKLRVMIRAMNFIDILPLMPDQGQARIVHGDWLHNCLVGSDAKIAAVLDWEILALGDPLADLAYALNQWALPEDETPGRDNAATALGISARVIWPRFTVTEQERPI